MKLSMKCLSHLQNACQECQLLMSNFVTIPTFFLSKIQVAKSKLLEPSGKIDNFSFPSLIRYHVVHGLGFGYAFSLLFC
jgi:hypothetical protein